MRRLCRLDRRRGRREASAGRGKWAIPAARPPRGSRAGACFVACVEHSEKSVDLATELLRREDNVCRGLAERGRGGSRPALVPHPPPPPHVPPPPPPPGWATNVSLDDECNQHLALISLGHGGRTRPTAGPRPVERIILRALRVRLARSINVTQPSPSNTLDHMSEAGQAVR